MKKYLIIAALTAFAVGAQANIVFDQYSAVTAGFLTANGGAAVDPANANATITKLTAAKLSFNGALYGGQSITTFNWIVANTTGAAVTARMRVRFYADNSNTLGTYLGGYSFAALALAAGASGFTSGVLPTGSPILPTSGVVWAGITFDNSGAATTTAAQLNGLGMFVADLPPTVGSEGTGNNDEFFTATAAGNGLVNNLPGTVGNYGTDPANGKFVNQTWQIQANAVPEPASFALLGLGAAALLRRRRSN